MIEFLNREMERRGIQKNSDISVIKGDVFHRYTTALFMAIMAPVALHLLYSRTLKLLKYVLSSDKKKMEKDVFIRNLYYKDFKAPRKRSPRWVLMTRYAHLMCFIVLVLYLHTFCAQQFNRIEGTNILKNFKESRLEIITTTGAIEEWNGKFRDKFIKEIEVGKEIEENGNIKKIKEIEKKNEMRIKEMQQKLGNKKKLIEIGNKMKIKEIENEMKIEEIDYEKRIKDIENEMKVAGDYMILLVNFHQERIDRMAVLVFSFLFFVISLVCLRKMGKLFPEDEWKTHFHMCFFTLLVFQTYLSFYVPSSIVLIHVESPILEPHIFEVLIVYVTLQFFVSSAHIYSRGVFKKF